MPEKQDVDLGPAGPGPKRESGRFAKGVSGNPSGKRKDTVQAPVPSPPTPRRNDAFVSASSGIGQWGVDKRVGHVFCAEPVSYIEAMELWRGNHIAARAVELVPSECFRKGYEITVANEDGGVERAREAEEKLKLIQANARIKRAYELERGFGGGAVLLGANDGQEMAAPLNMKKVSSFDFMTALEPVQVWPAYFYGDPLAPKYGEPSIYQVNASARGTTISGPTFTTGYVHESRLIVFPGIRVSQFQAQSGAAGAYWGDSIFTRFVEVLRDFSIAAASIGIIVTDFSQLIVQVKGLAQMLSEDSGGVDGFERRMQIMNRMRSTARAVIADVEETVTKQSTSVAGLRDLADWLSANLAGAIGIPLTLLMGTSPKGGLGSEGALDERWFYGHVSNVQTDRLEPALKRPIECAFLTTGDGKIPKSWGITWRSLWEPTDVEMTQARLNQAMIDEKMIMQGVLHPMDVLRNRYGSAKYSFETSVDMSEYEAMHALGTEPPQPGDREAATLPPGALPGGGNTPPPPGGAVPASPSATTAATAGKGGTQEPAAANAAPPHQPPPAPGTPGVPVAAPAAPKEPEPATLDPQEVLMRGKARMVNPYVPPPEDPGEPDPNTPSQTGGPWVGADAADAADPDLDDMTYDERENAAQYAMDRARASAQSGDFAAAAAFHSVARGHAVAAAKLVKAGALTRATIGATLTRAGTEPTVQQHAAHAEIAQRSAHLAMKAGDERGMRRHLAEARVHLENAAKASRAQRAGMISEDDEVEGESTYHGHPHGDAALFALDGDEQARDPNGRFAGGESVTEQVLGGPTEHERAAVERMKASAGTHLSPQTPGGMSRGQLAQQPAHIREKVERDLRRTTAAAQAATERALIEKTAVAHVAAGEAHRSAEASHRSVESGELAERHARVAGEHEKRAAKMLRGDFDPDQPRAPDGKFGETSTHEEHGAKAAEAQQKGHEAAAAGNHGEAVAHFKAAREHMKGAIHASKKAAAHEKGEHGKAAHKPEAHGAKHEAHGEHGHEHGLAEQIAEARELLTEGAELGGEVVIGKKKGAE